MADNSGAGASNPNQSIDEQDLLLPISNIGRIMKQILPPHAKISKEGKETMQECLSEFICFITEEASEKCREEKRKILSGDDICWAMQNLGLDNFAQALRRYVQRYRQFEGDRAH